VSYESDVREMASIDTGEGGAACGAGAISEETLMACYGECSRLLARIRDHERANNLTPTKWHYDGSIRNRAP